MRIIVIAILLLLVGFVGWQVRSKEPKPNSPVSDTPAATETVHPPSIDEAALATQLQIILNDNTDLDIGICVTDFSTDTIYDYGQQSPYYAASVTKVLTATFFLTQVEAGNYSLDDYVGGNTARQQLKLMLENSDNPARDAFNELLGKDNVQVYAKTLGLNYDAHENTLTVKEAAILMQKLYNEKLLSTANTDLILAHLTAANPNQYLRVQAPAGSVVYQKAGWLADRLHVAGIIEVGDSAYGIVIFSRTVSGGDYDFQRGQQLIDQIVTALNSARK